MIRILLVDDQSLLRVGFKLVLETQPDFVVVGETGTASRRLSWPPNSNRTWS